MPLRLRQEVQALSRRHRTALNRRFSTRIARGAPEVGPRYSAIDCKDSCSMFSNPAALFGSVLFGAVGFVALIYGKKMVLWKPMVFGGALMVYPYFVPQIWLIYAIGCALCLGLYIFRG